MSEIKAAILVQRIVSAEYQFMRKLGYSAADALAHAIRVKQDFWNIFRSAIKS